jgi:putative phosphoribosyl transferase
MRFANRQTAGRLLAEALRPLAAERPLVLGLPRGGVVVAAEVARALDARLDVLVVRKLGAPDRPELGVGAVSEGSVLCVDEGLRAALRIADGELARMVARERQEVARRVARLRGGRALPPLAGRTVILVDDGVATGGTALAAIRAVRMLEPARLVFATPVCAPDAADLLGLEADDFVALAMPRALLAIGVWYDDFSQVDDEEVAALLAGREGAPAQT